MKILTKVSHRKSKGWTQKSSRSRKSIYFYSRTFVSQILGHISFSMVHLSHDNNKNDSATLQTM